MDHNAYSDYCHCCFTICYVDFLYVTKRLTSVMNRMRLITDGDLTKRPFKPEPEDQIVQLMLTTSDMIQSMHELLNRIGQVANIVNNYSDTLTKSVVKIRYGAGQIATTMDDLASAQKNKPTVQVIYRVLWQI